MKNITKPFGHTGAVEFFIETRLLKVIFSNRV